MAEPVRSPRPLSAALAAMAMLSGCSVVSKARLDECHTLSKGLRAENAQLKDVSLRLRSQNQDLAQRSLDEARRIAELETARQRLERSVLAYQEERERLVAAFEQFRGALTASADRSPAASLAPDPFEVFARDHPGCGFDPASAVATFPIGELFDVGSGDLSPDGLKLLDDFGGLLDWSDFAMHRLAVRIGPTAADDHLSLAGQSPPPPPGGPRLEDVRALAVRDILADRVGQDPSRIALVPTDPAGEAVVEVRLLAEATHVLDRAAP